MSRKSRKSWEQPFAYSSPLLISAAMPSHAMYLSQLVSWDFLKNVYFLLMFLSAVYSFSA